MDQSNPSAGTIALEHIKLSEETSSGDCSNIGVSLPIRSDKMLTTIPLENSVPSKKDKPRVPRRILHFSDGILEEYSTDEEEEVKKSEPEIDPKTLTWLPWMWYYFVTAAYKMLNTADACGEKIAWVLGITSPKYQYILDEYHRRKKEELLEQMEDEMLVNNKRDPEVVIHEPESDKYEHELDKREKDNI